MLRYVTILIPPTFSFLSVDKRDFVIFFGILYEQKDIYGIVRALLNLLLLTFNFKAFIEL